MTKEEALTRLRTTDACDSELCEALNMAIEALEQEQCGDCISRYETYKKMLDLQCKKRERYLDIDDVHNVIYKMPPVSPIPKWIPVSERLPEQDRKDEAGNDIAFLVQTEWGTFFTATYDGNWCHVDSSILVESDVIAWMPLPLPYKQEVEE